LSRVVAGNCPFQFTAGSAPPVASPPSQKKRAGAPARRHPIGRARWCRRHWGRGCRRWLANPFRAQRSGNSLSTRGALLSHRRINCALAGSWCRCGRRPFADFVEPRSDTTDLAMMRCLADANRPVLPPSARGDLGARSPSLHKIAANFRGSSPAEGHPAARRRGQSRSRDRKARYRRIRGGDGVFLSPTKLRNWRSVRRKRGAEGLHDVHLVGFLSSVIPPVIPAIFPSAAARRSRDPLMASPNHSLESASPRFALA